MANEAIAAIATPPGRGGIGVVRVSGPHLGEFLLSLINARAAPRRATRADFRDAQGGVIDQGLVLYFPAPHSYTGEDVVELHGHGGPVVMQLLLRRCLELGARVAEPGEFTKRAFLNEKLDLAQAESVADLIDASTAEAARCAVRSLRGEFSGLIEALVRELIELRTLVEATLDFPEEEVDGLTRNEVAATLNRLRARLERVIASSRQGSLLREGIHVVLAGEPNVGKSSLLNRLAGNERAIVTDVPGTTRDAIRETISIGGVPLHIIDTAGLREPQDQVEKIGISRTWEMIAQADMVLWLRDVTQPVGNPADLAFPTQLPAGIPCVRVANKADLLGPAAGGLARVADEVLISAKTGAGMESLQRAILDNAGWKESNEGVFMARARHLDALNRAMRHLEQALLASTQLELCAEELRSAQYALSSITGEFSADDLLGEIFSRFCLGK